MRRTGSTTGQLSNRLSDRKLSNRKKSDSGILVRAGLIVLLVIGFVGALRWAMGVTNANTHQISNGLTRVQGSMDTSHASAAVQRSFAKRDRDQGPTIEPEESGGQHK